MQVDKEKAKEIGSSEGWNQNRPGADSEKKTIIKAVRVTFVISFYPTLHIIVVTILLYCTSKVISVWPFFL